jgi:hypothetical protein
MKVKTIVFTTILFTLFLMFSPISNALVTVNTNVTTNTTWGDTPAESEILLQGAIFVEAPATLTIQAGTTIYGEKASIGTLVVDQGAKIQALGTSTSPIVFTSDQAAPARGDWGGLIINGFAPLNVPGGTAEGEGDTGTFGGNMPNDDSGTLQYVRVEYAGIEFTPENELNGIAFQGVGSATTVDHIQVSFNKDDGIEMFGGTVNLKYVLCTGIGDDSFDYTMGWTGKGQFWVAQQRADDADQGFECDNWSENNNALPRANPTIYNFTVIGDPFTTYGDESDVGMLLREGTAGTFMNGIVQGFKDDGIDIDDEATYQQAQGGTLVVDNCIFWGNVPNFGDSSDDTGFTPPFTVWEFMRQIMQNNQVIDPMLGDPYNQSDPDFAPAAGSPAVNGTVPVATPPNDGFFDTTVDFIGGVDPDSDWTQEAWTSFGSTSGCPVALALNNDRGQLSVLRDFRDNVLKKSVLGFGMAVMYYKYSPEVVSMLRADEDLREETRQLLTELVPEIQSVTEGGNMAITDAQLANIKALAGKIASQASPDLKEALDQFIRGLDDGYFL